MHKIQLLLVDDHPIVRVGLRALLEMEPDMQVVGEASTGAQAVGLVLAACPDVIVMDISMPEMDGLEATRRVRAACPCAHILILTVHAQERYLFPVLKAGASGYVLKSTIDTELINAIRTVAQGEAFLYPSAARMVLEHYLAHLHDDGQDAYEQLSEREREVLKLIVLGHTAGEIGEHLTISPKSAETYRARIMQKLDLHSRAALVRYALARGLLAENV